MLDYVFSFEVIKEKNKKLQVEGYAPYTLVVHFDDDEVNDVERPGRMFLFNLSAGTWVERGRSSK